MFVSRELLDPALVLTAALAAISAALLILAVPRPHLARRLPVSDRALIGAALGVAALAAYAATGRLVGTAAAVLVAALLCLMIRRGLPRLSAAGVIHTALAPASLMSGAAWTFALVQDHAFPPWVAGLAAAGAALGLVVFAFHFASGLVEDAVYTHADWRRPTHAPPARPGGYAPKVSIHVPCYAEPPEVVIQTLQRLAELQYPNYEVLVCDNNTPDEALWRPLQRFCAQANLRTPGRFRFFHVAPLAGAKAGALNYCLARTAPDAELVAVVDADYLAEADFLGRLARFFADPKVGFVQTPHDYRRDGSAYQAMCYWEYMPPNKVGLAALNEYDCAYTIGTMCILRKDAIAAAGGWAEWCLTEDSEISIRIRALGYEGVYVNETFGRGLIPETYADLKKQRFRWTAGPVQQLRAHWRLFLPRRLGGSEALHGWVKLMEVRRSLAPVLETLGLVGGFLALCAGIGLLVTGRLPQLQLPPAFWVAAALTTGAGLTRVWAQYRLTGCTAPHAILGAEAARLSLGWVKAVAAVAALSGRPLKWRRTPKFAAGSSLGRALYACAPETALAAAFGLLLPVPLRHVAVLGTGAAVFATAACAAMTAAFLTAPLMAALSEARLRALDGGLGREPEAIVEPPLPRAA